MILSVAMSPAVARSSIGAGTLASPTRRPSPVPVWVVLSHGVCTFGLSAFGALSRVYVVTYVNCWRDTC